MPSSAISAIARNLTISSRFPGWLLRGFEAGKFQMAFLSYMEFISTISQKLAVKQLLPIRAEEITSPETPVLPMQSLKSDYLSEPRAEEIFSTLCRNTSSFNSIMSYSRQLLPNIPPAWWPWKCQWKCAGYCWWTDFEYNRARQSKITNELLDVVGARMALE